MKKHLAVFDKETAHRILSGQKTVEVRFSQKRISPYGEVSIGDLVYIKEAGKEVAGQFLVGKVISIEGLEEKDWQIIKEKYGEEISLGSPEKDEQFFRIHKLAQFATVIFIGKVEQFVVSPISVGKRDRRGWVVLG
jgi:hypothetical protein